MCDGHLEFQDVRQHFVGPTTYITLLRDPISRVISLYYYIRRTEGHRFHDEIHRKEWSLREYLEESGNLENENWMTRQLSGRIKGKVTNKEFQQAVSRLENHFAVAGTVERFDASLLLMKRKFGWTSVYYRKRNVTRDRPTREDLSAETLDAIRSKNQYDLKLYRHAQSSLLSELDEVDLRAEHRLLQLTCAAYTGYDRLRGAFRSAGSTLYSI